MTQTTQACVFDAYGTLFDVHSAVDRLRDRVGPDASGVSQLWRRKQLEYTWLRSLMGRHADFWHITGDALEYALSVHAIDNAALRDDLMNAYRQLDCYPEVPAALRALRALGYRTAILSNGTHEMLDSAVAHAGLSSLLDATLSVESVGVYKPDPRVYQLAVDRLNLEDPQCVWFQSSNAWDAVGAASFGFNVAWINRFGQARERLGFQPDLELSNLSDLVDHLKNP